MAASARQNPFEFGGELKATTATAAPATIRLVHLEVVGREQMAIAADTGGNAIAVIRDYRHIPYIARESGLYLGELNARASARFT